MKLHGTSKINGSGHLEIGGCDVTELVEQYGTPLYVMDESLIRQRAREFKLALEASGFRFQVAYASKALCIMAMCKLAEQEGLLLDVVSDGELFTALKAGFPVERIVFHGNNKSPFELEMAVDARIGYVVVDNFTELHLLDELAGRRDRRVSILFRVTPGVEARTHEYISTGQTDSKFGFDMSNGQARQAIEAAKELANVEIVGIHSHIGSQQLEAEGFREAALRVAEFVMNIRTELDVTLQVINMGGGLGIRYKEGDIPPQISEYVEAITRTIKTSFSQANYPLPEIWIEPGRSMVGDAGTTLYTIGTFKNIPGVRKYVAVDGGMMDNPRPALYKSVYEAMLANRANEDDEEVVSIAGKACESGDMLIWNISLPKARTGDILAVSCTGAYNYSLASNYNRIRRPAVVFVQAGQASLVVQRESHEQIVANDMNLE